MASALAPSVPTRRQISRPGPTVTAIASTSAAERRPARSSASATVVASAASCASRATPGTTPPHSSCRAACEASASPRMAPSLRTTATPVSSQLVSMPSTVNGAPPAAGSGRVPATRNPESRVGPRSTALGSPTCARDAAALQQTTDPPRRQGAAARRGKAATPAVQASAESSTRDVGSRDIFAKSLTRVNIKLAMTCHPRPRPAHPSLSWHLLHTLTPPPASPRPSLPTPNTKV